jgi:hypothetical protein
VTRDDTKLNFYSGWDIDQLYDSKEVAVTAGTATVFTIPATLPTIPVFEVQFKPTGDTKWYQSGTYSTNGTLAGLNNFYVHVQSGAVKIVSAGGTARYFVWTDKVDY